MVVYCFPVTADAPCQQRGIAYDAAAPTNTPRTYLLIKLDFGLGRAALSKLYTSTL